MTGLVHLHPFLYVYHPYSLSGSLVRPFHFAVPLHLANACCSFVFKPFGRADLKDLHKFLGSQPKRSKKKKKIQVQRFSPSKTDYKNIPWPSLFMPFYSLQQVFTAEPCSSPRNCGTALQLLKCKWPDPNLGRFQRNRSDVALNTYGNMF